MSRWAAWSSGAAGRWNCWGEWKKDPALLVSHKQDGACSLVFLWWTTEEYVAQDSWGKKDEWAPVNQLVHFSSLSRYIHVEGAVFHAAGSPAPVCGAVKMSPQQNYAVHTIDTIPVSVVTFDLHLFCNVEISIVLPFTHQASGDIEIIIFHEVYHGKHTEDCFTLLPV